MSYTQILFEKNGAVATVTMNRPEKLNAYSEIMVHEILSALGDARDDDAIRAVILTATGRGFWFGRRYQSGFSISTSPVSRASSRIDARNA